MPDRPLLILPAPGQPQGRAKKSGGPGSAHLPTRARQGERLVPRFAALQQAFNAKRARLRVEPGGLAPEEVVVLETAGPVQDFIVAVRNIEGLEWLGELEEEEVPPDDDFFLTNKRGVPQMDRAIR